jgi:hypothetical protein
MTITETKEKLQIILRKMQECKLNKNGNHCDNCCHNLECNNYKWYNLYVIKLEFEKVYQIL